jgi:hypothetical protein
MDRISINVEVVEFTDDPDMGGILKKLPMAGQI